MHIFIQYKYRFFAFVFVSEFLTRRERIVVSLSIAAKKIMVDVSLIVTSVLFAILVVIASIYFVVYFQSPTDKWIAWFPKIVVVRVLYIQIQPPISDPLFKLYNDILNL